MKGRFITLEGIDGAGKSTHLEWIANLLREQGKKVVVSREPGGSPLGEKLREILLSQPMHLETEALLMFAARREHVDKVISPALDSGIWVVCDRFTDATYAYQGGGKGLRNQRIEVLEKWVHAKLQPHLTFLFDVPVEIGHKRLGPHQDRFEKEGKLFFEKVRNAYLKRAKRFPKRFRIIDSSLPITNIQELLKKILLTLC